MTPPTRILFWVSLFSIAFAFVEASVVVYLRALYYPEGFEFPLKLITPEHLKIEFLREVATIIMLAVVGIVAGKKRWERFGYFLLAFGLWDIFYYVGLKAVIDWPQRLMDWDVLFLIPVPWIGPVLAPLLIALLMTILGPMIVLRVSRGLHFHPSFFSWVVSVTATAILVYSFIVDVPATLKGEMPAPYEYGFLWAGLFLYLLGFYLACRTTISGSGHIV